MIFDDITKVLVIIHEKMGEGVKNGPKLLVFIYGRRLRTFTFTLSSHTTRYPRNSVSPLLGNLGYPGCFPVVLKSVINYNMTNHGLLHVCLVAVRSLFF